MFLLISMLLLLSCVPCFSCVCCFLLPLVCLLFLLRLLPFLFFLRLLFCHAVVTFADVDAFVAFCLGSAAPQTQRRVISIPPLSQCSQPGVAGADIPWANLD